MICLIYFSSAVGEIDAGELSRILEVSRRNNTSAGVTGLLCHNDGSFLQFLEGPRDAVQATFDRISSDPRHADVILVESAEIDERAFGEWSMAVVRPNDVTPQARTFVQELEKVSVSPSAAHAPVIESFLESFRAWLR